MCIRDRSPASITTTGLKAFTFTITGNVGNGTPSIFLQTSNIDTSIKIRGLKVSKQSSSTYLTSDVTNPREDLDFLTVADYTFCVNKQKTVQQSETQTPDYSSSAVVFIKQIGYKTSYTVGTNLGSVTAVTGTSDASQKFVSGWNLQLTTDHGDDALNVSQLITGTSYHQGYYQIKAGLAPRLNNINGLSSYAIGGKSVFVSGHSSIEVSDTLSSEGIGLVWKTVDSISDLPIFACLLYTSDAADE